MAQAAKDAFNKGMDLVRSGRPEPDPFEQLRKGIGFVEKKCPEELDQLDDDDKRKVLDCLMTRGLTKKMHKPRAVEGLKNALENHPQWIKVAREWERAEELKEFMHDQAAVFEKLTEEIKEPEPVVEEPKEPEPVEEEEEVVNPDVTNTGAAGDAAAEAPKPKPKPKRLNVAQELKIGRDCMEKFGWEFPHDPLGTKLDEATVGFQHFFDGMTKCTTTTGRKSVEDKHEGIDELLLKFEDDFKGMLNFCVTMYKAKGRMSYRARVKFVVVKLREFSPAFDTCCGDREKEVKQPLPWEPHKAKEDYDAEEEAIRQAELAAEQAEKERLAALRGPPKPQVIWIDYKAEAFSTWVPHEQIRFRGFHDDPEAADYVPREQWLQNVIDTAEDPTDRVVAVITNKAHLQTVIDIRNFCASCDEVEPPIFIVCTRGSAKDFAEWGIEEKFITTDWHNATSMAVRQVKQEYPTLFPEEEDKPYTAWLSLDPRTGGLDFYPGEIAKRLEIAWQRRQPGVDLGSSFFGAKVQFDQGKIVQRTAKGSRDCARVELARPDSEVSVHVAKGEDFRLARGGYPTASAERRAQPPPGAAVELSQCAVLR